MKISIKPILVILTFLFISNNIKAQEELKWYTGLFYNHLQDLEKEGKVKIIKNNLNDKGVGKVMISPKNEPYNRIGLYFEEMKKMPPMSIKASVMFDYKTQDKIIDRFNKYYVKVKL